MASPEPQPGFGVFVVLTGDENHCRPECVRTFFYERVGGCRIVTSSRSYSNEKTFVTLEFTKQGLVRKAVEGYNGHRINGCHASVAYFRSRCGPVSNANHGSRSRGGYADSRWNRGSSGPQGGYNQRGTVRKGRSWGEQEGDKLRGMSPASAARYIENRLAAKEQRQRGEYQSNSRSNNRSQSRSPSHFRSRSRSRSRSESRSRSGSASSHSHSHSWYHNRLHGRSWRSPDSEELLEHSVSPSNHRAHSVASPNLHNSGDSDEANRVSDDDQSHHRHPQKHHRSPSESDSDSSGRRRRRRQCSRRRKHHRHRQRSNSDSEVDQFCDLDQPELESMQHVDEWHATEDTVDNTQVAEVEEMLALKEPQLILMLPSVALSSEDHEKLIQKRESLEQEYRADVSTVLSVTKMLTSYDKSLKGRLQTALKSCLHDICQRYVQEFQESCAQI